MKKCVIYANCFGQVIKRLLENHPEFSAEYEITLYTNYEMIKSRDILPLEGCELIIHQPLKEEYGILSTKYIKDHKPDGCISILVPQLFNTGFIPTCQKEGNNSFYHDIDNYPPTPKRLQINYKWSLDFLKKREAECDIKVFDFIVENYRKHRLFLTPHHATTYLYEYVLNCILNKLSYSPVNLDIAVQQHCYTAHPLINGIKYPIHSKVAETLGLEWVSESIIDDNFYINEYNRMLLCRGNTVGFYYFPYENYAVVEGVLGHTRKYYPNNPIYLLSDNGADFTSLAQKYNCIYEYAGINLGQIQKRIEKYDNAARKTHTLQITEEMNARFKRACMACKTDWIVKLEDDIIVRGSIRKFPQVAGGTMINSIPPNHALGYYLKKQLHDPNFIFKWGLAGGSIVRSEAVLEAVDSFQNKYIWLVNNDKLKWSGEFLSCHDVTLCMALNFSGFIVDNWEFEDSGMSKTINSTYQI